MAVRGPGVVAAPGFEISAARRVAQAVGLCAALLLAPMATAASGELRSLTAERELITAELEQYQKTVAILHTDGNPPEQSANPAVRKLAGEMVALKERLLAVTEREVTLLQQELTSSRDSTSAATPAEPALEPTAMESKPLRTTTVDDSQVQESDQVSQLHRLLQNYYTELQESAATLPTEEELAQREAARRQAAQLERIPFNVDKVRLSGAEGSTALTQITERLSDPNLPESRRDIAPICSVKTRLFGNLIASENRSLKPVGKHNYVAKLRLQPGDTTVRIQGHHWEIRLPQDGNTNEYLVTLYKPPGARPEFHVFSVDELLAQENAHIPAWLPDDFQVKKRAG